MLSFIFVILVLTPSGILLCCIFDVSGCGTRTLETRVKTLVYVSVAVVDAWTIPWSGRTTPGIISVYYTPVSVPAPSSLRKSFQKSLIVWEGRD